MFVVGPESAGAHPGPVCYRKNGYLAVTDANAVLGRVVPEEFPNIFGPKEDEPLDVAGARAAFEELTKLPEAQGRTPEELAYGFLQVANEAMCRPIRNLTQMKGFDITTHVLACFGGVSKVFPKRLCRLNYSDAFYSDRRGPNTPAVWPRPWACPRSLSIATVVS